MEPIFTSECHGRGLEVRCYPGLEERFQILTVGPGLTLGLFLEREDAEALARAILGIADPLILDWDGIVADMADEAAAGARATWLAGHPGSYEARAAS